MAAQEREEQEDVTERIALGPDVEESRAAEVGATQSRDEQDRHQLIRRALMTVPQTDVEHHHPQCEL